MFFELLQVLIVLAIVGLFHGILFRWVIWPNPLVREFFDW